MNNVYLIDVLWPNSKVNNLVRKIFIFAIGVILLIASAKINIPIPPVPITLQTLVVLVFAASVGWRYATSSFTAYMFLGFIGIPVFATWPYAGPAFFYGPAIGYVLGMLIASFFVGYLAEKNYDRNYFKSLVIIFIGNIIIFVPGLFWLGIWYNIFSSGAADLNFSQSYLNAFDKGLLVYKYTEPIKIALTASITPLLWQYISKK